ncbi:MAG: methyltransferase [Bacteroidia bacterium]
MNQNEFTEEYWTQRYQNNDAAWDLGAPSTPLKEYIDHLENKDLNILIPGAGNAYEAEYLFDKKFKNVTVIDISPEPLKNIQQRLPDFPEKNLILGDFFSHKGSYDLIIEQTFFCALKPSLRSQYVDHMAELLKPNGKLAGVLFTDPINALKPPFGATKEEYTHLFESKFKFKTFEICKNSIKPREGRELFIELIKK